MGVIIRFGVDFVKRWSRVAKRMVGELGGDKAVGVAGYGGWVCLVMAAKVGKREVDLSFDPFFY